MAEARRRYVEENVLVSTYLPPIRIRVDDRLEYVGNVDFDLYGLAQADLYLFAEAPGGRLRRLLWVQFEGFHEDNDRTYNYPVTNLVTLGAHEYIHDIGLGEAAAMAAQRPGGEWERILALLGEKDLAAKGEVVIQRFVRMVDGARRDELMLMYGEELGETGLAAADFSTPEQEAALQEKLADRARAAFTVLEG